MPDPQAGEPLIFGDRIRCPHCGDWRHKDSFTTLNLPDNANAEQCALIHKCGGEGGCKGLFAIKDY